MKHLIIFLLLIQTSACAQKKKKYTSPPQYDLNRPVIYQMPKDLEEISGIAFYQGNSNLLFAEQDEIGNVYYLKPGDQKAEHFSFGKDGDYEDIALTDNNAFLLRSDGVVFNFPFDGKNLSAGNVREFKNILPKGEYEGMYADVEEQKLYILCKNCNDDEKSALSGYIFDLNEKNFFRQSGTFSIKTEQIKKLYNGFKTPFRPSALAKNKKTNEWYILSSVNKLLAVADDHWQIKNVYPLNPELYVQPEGIAFDKENNLYISNEGANIQNGTIFKFP